MDFFNKYKKEIILVVSSALITFLLCLGLVPRDTPSTSPNKTVTKASATLSKPSTSVTYVGSKNSDKYHKTDCRWAKNIKSYNKVTFSSESAARIKGYTACSTCID